MNIRHKILSILSIIVLVIALTPIYSYAQRSSVDTIVKLAPIGTTKVWGVVNGISIEGAVEGPSTEATPLQIACVFEYTDGDIFTSPPALPEALNGMVHLDKALDGVITELRKSGRFTGHANETILLTPVSGKLPAKKILLIGLGDRSKFSPELMKSIGQIALREAIKLNVTSFAFASDLKDAGIESPTALVASDVVKGVIEAYRTELFLKQKKMSSSQPFTKITLLAGPSFFETAGQGIKEAINTLNK